MTNEQIVESMWRSYQQGIQTDTVLNGSLPYYRKLFLAWVGEEYPQLLKKLDIDELDCKSALD